MKRITANRLLSKEKIEYINELLTHIPKSESDMLITEDDTYSETVYFGNGMEMDIKICGVQYQEGEDNLPWTEAVLFKNGCEVACSDPDESYLGEWELEHDGVIYQAVIS